MKRERENEKIRIYIKRQLKLYKFTFVSIVNIERTACEGNGSV